MNVNARFSLRLTLCAFLICELYSKSFLDVTEEQRENSKKRQMEAIADVFRDKKGPVMLTLKFPGTLKNRVYKNSGIYFEITIVSAKSLKKANITSQCAIFDLTTISAFYSKNCLKCFSGRYTNVTYWPLWASMNSAECRACFDATMMSGCNTVSVSSISDDSIPIISHGFFLQTNFLHVSDYDFYKPTPGLPNVFKIYKSNSRACSHTETTAVLPRASVFTSTRNKFFTESDIKNLGIICRASQNGYSVPYQSEVSFKSGELSTSCTLSLVTLSNYTTAEPRKLQFGEVTIDLSGERMLDFTHFTINSYPLLIQRVGGATFTGERLIEGQMALVGSTQYGVRIIKEAYKLQTSASAPLAGKADISQEKSTIYKVGCFSWIHNKWFTIVSASNTTDRIFKENKIGSDQFLASFYGNIEDKVWQEILWTKLYHLKKTNKIVSLKCDQLGNILIWSTLDEDNNIHVMKANIHQEHGTIIGEPVTLEDDYLCSCSSHRFLGSAAVDILYEQVNDPYSSILAVLCGGTSICLLPLDGKKGNRSSVLLEFSNFYFIDEITWFQLDQLYIYFVTKGIGFVKVMPRNYQKSPLGMNADMVTHLLFDETYYYAGYFERNISGTASIISFDVLKDIWNLPAPPHHCMYPKLHKTNAKASMESITTLKLHIYIRWIRSKSCNRFARPRLRFLVKYVQTISHEITPNNSRFVTLIVDPDSSSTVNEFIFIKNITPEAWYLIKMRVQLKDFLDTKAQRLWYSGRSEPEIDFKTFTHYSFRIKTTESNLKYYVTYGAVGIFILLLPALGIASYFAWEGNRKWEVSQRLARLDKSQIRLIKKIGEGQFGEVWKASWQKDSNTEETIVVKTLKVEKASTQDQMAFREEAILGSKFDCVYIVNTIGICLQSRPIMLAFEYMNGGSLDKYLSNESYQEFLTAPDLLYLIQCALEACIYLENEGYVHRDIAARNFLVSIVSTDDPKPKLLKMADFGLAKDVGVDSFYQSDKAQLIPLNSSAPESLKVPSISDNKSDVWSFGVLIYEMFSWASVPFGPCKLPKQQHHAPCRVEQVDFRTLPKKLINEHYSLLMHPMPCVAHFNEILMEIMEMCWKFNPCDRPTFKLLKQLFLQKSQSITRIQLKPLRQYQQTTMIGSDLSAQSEDANNSLMNELVVIDWESRKTYGALSSDTLLEMLSQGAENEETKI